jgi:arginase family enzyme
MTQSAGTVGPADASRVARFSGLGTFARLPTVHQVGRWDIGVVAGDVVEVSPAYDHTEITAIAAAHVLYDLVTTMAAPVQA